jgi:hypothetical protein
MVSQTLDVVGGNSLRFVCGAVADPPLRAEEARFLLNAIEVGRLCQFEQGVMGGTPATPDQVVAAVGCARAEADA